MKSTMNQSINVGVDTGKYQLDIYLRPLDIYFSVSNDEKGIKEAIQAKLSRLKHDNMQAMSDLVARRSQLLAMQTMEKNRLQILPKELAMTIKPILTAFKNQIEKIETKIAQLIEKSPTTKIKA